MAQVGGRGSMAAASQTGETCILGAGSGCIPSRKWNIADALIGTRAVMFRGSTSVIGGAWAMVVPHLAVRCDPLPPLPDIGAGSKPAPTGGACAVHRTIHGMR